MSLATHKQDWEDLGSIDPLWAVLTDSTRQYGRWNVDDFFATGEKEIESLISEADRLGFPLKRDFVLDFGCGVGRLTRALAKHFGRCYGIDISESMINKAKELNSSVPNCEFLLSSEEHLKIFPNDHFDLIYTRIVLQHIPNSSIIKSYITEFMRILKPGGLLVFQLPSYIPLKKRIQPRRRLYAFLRACGISNSFLYNKLHLVPIRMNYIPEREVVDLVSLAGKVLEIRKGTDAGPTIQSRTYYVTK